MSWSKEKNTGSYLWSPFFQSLYEQDHVGYMAMIRWVKSVEVERLCMMQKSRERLVDAERWRCFGVRFND